MIKSMFVKNFVLIDELSLDFHPLFSTFTGETGAGKSLFIDALSILCGDRINTSYIQRGADKAIIEASFVIPQKHSSRSLLDEAGYSLEDDDTLIVSREFTTEGKSTARINQRQTTVSFLKDVMGKLVDIHSQHDSQYLLNAKSHIELLDSFMNEPQLVDEVKCLYKDYRNLKKALESVLDETFNLDDLAFYEFQWKEIDDLAIQEGEMERLEEIQKEMASYERVSSKLNNALALFDETHYENLFTLHKELDDIVQSDVRKISEEVLSAYYVISEQRDNLHAYMDGLEYDEETFNEVQTRLYDIQKIIRKHGYSYDDLVKKQTELSNKIKSMKNREAYIEQEEIKIQKAYSLFTQKAVQLSKKRKEAALVLSTEIKKELVDLHLDNAVFEVNFEDDENLNGIDKVEFYISMNKGDETRPLVKVISGGELSRLMLGLKTIFSKLQNIQLVVFDEIDTGVSGNVAFAIGKKMKKIADETQVFSITHLASVAAWGDYQYKVEKHDLENKTITKIVELDKEARIIELAKIASNSTSEQALSAAKELFDSAH